MLDLRKAKPGDVYVDGYGNKVRILCNDRNVEEFKVVSLIEINGREEIETYNLHGLYWGGDGCDDTKTSKSDLVKRLDE